ncbi:MAG: glycosyltransferase [Haliscomenobacter sp.]|nr:glycosyltransferase [Haliscomenobacter sp.]
MKYSIIIATFNRLEELKELIASVRAFDFPKDGFELIISDDGSWDGTGEYLRAQSFDFPFQYLFQENKGPGEARNHGMRQARGDYFLFIDSDCIIPSDYLTKVDRFLEAQPVDAFGGPDDCHPSFPPLLKAINYSMTSFLGTGGTRGSKKSVTKFYPRSFNMGIHRKVFGQIGGMNQLRHGQDMDLSARIYEAGFKVALIPDAFVYHKRRTNLRRFYKQIFNWGVARINLGAKYPDLLKPIHLAPAALVAGAALVVLLAVFFPLGKLLLMLMLAGIAGVAALAFAQSFQRYKSLRVSLLSIVTLFLQVFAYGMGAWSGIWQKVTGRKVAKGFTRDYYK